jgi:ADP-ribosylglycohydrolase
MRKFIFLLSFSFTFVNPAFVQIKKSNLTKEELHNKVLGMLLGSAIGDAMGAPTEMWGRDYIKMDYGFVDQLDSATQGPSPEGSWLLNAPAGGTTDDTRWKKLMFDYMSNNTDKAEFDAKKFAGFINKEYEKAVKSLKNTEGYDPLPFEANEMRMAWLQEWAAVARPFQNNDFLSYNNALSRFYGGEMVCGGLLYAPAAGLFFPENPLKAYEETYKISIFDLGYARDLTALAAAMTSAAMAKDATPTKIFNVFREIDPQNFFRSRLVGRSSYRILREARQIVFDARKLQAKDIDTTKFIFPKHLKVDTLYMARMAKAFELLDLKNQDMPFHAGEISLIVLTGMIFADLDFEKAITFLVNYGRDNDTTTAVLGGILGAYWGADKLPKDMVQKVSTVNKKYLDMDFEEMANKLTDKIYSLSNK